MIIKIGGIEIDRISDVDVIEQGQEGLVEIGVDSVAVISEYTIDIASPFFTFGLF